MRILNLFKFMNKKIVDLIMINLNIFMKSVPINFFDVAQFPISITLEVNIKLIVVSFITIVDPQ